MALIYTDDTITDEDWDSLLRLPLIPGLTKLLSFLRSRQDEAIPVRELPDFFKSSYPEQLNGKLSAHNLPFRVANEGKRSWTKVLPYESRALKLYKVVKPEKREEKPKGTPKCPPVYFNPQWNKPASDTSGKVAISFLGITDPEKPWTHVQMEIRAGLSVGIGGRGFIHFLPSPSEMDKIIGYLQEMRSLMPKEST